MSHWELNAFLKSSVVIVLILERYIWNRYILESPHCLPNLWSEGYYVKKTPVGTYGITLPTKIISQRQYIIQREISKKITTWKI